MQNAVLVAEKINSDQEKILTAVLPIVDHTSAVLRAHLQNMLETGKRFGIKGFLIPALQKQLSTIMLSAHLTGMQRAILIHRKAAKRALDHYNSKKEKARRASQLSFDLESAELSLSVFGNVLNYLRNRLEVNLGELQKKYDTLAFKVLNSASEDVHSQLETVVQNLIREGAHVREARKVLGAEFDRLGLKPASRSQLETIFRTQTQIAFASGKYKAERHDKVVQDALWGYKYVTVGDDRVRPTHAVLDGVTLHKSHAFWKTFTPPNGFNCRCQAIPLFEEYPEVYPPKKIDGVEIKPDKGFVWSAGAVFNPLR